jgi:hypothetical protein
MRLDQLINRRGRAANIPPFPESSTPFATATVATVATLHLCKTPTVASVANHFSVKEGGKAPTVATVAVANHSENATTPSIEPTHRTTVDLIFNDPETGTVRTIPGGTPCRRFSGTTGAMLAGVKLDYMGEWAANKNIERGYGLIWIEGALRGVSFSDVEPLKGGPHD